MTLWDCLRKETQIYYIDELNVFFILDHKARAKNESLVVVRQLSRKEVLIEPYRGQPYIGVARVLGFYQLAQSEQGTPRPVRVYPD